MTLSCSSHITFAQILEARSCVFRHKGEFDRKKKDLVLVHFCSTIWLHKANTAMYYQMNCTNLSLSCVGMVLPIDMRNENVQDTDF